MTSAGFLPLMPAPLSSFFFFSKRGEGTEEEKKNPRKTKKKETSLEFPSFARVVMHEKGCCKAA